MRDGNWTATQCRMAAVAELLMLQIAAIQAGEVPFSIAEPSGIQRTNWPVTSSVPLHRGALSDPEATALLTFARPQCNRHFVTAISSQSAGRACCACHTALRINRVSVVMLEHDRLDFAGRSIRIFNKGEPIPELSRTA